MPNPKVISLFSGAGGLDLGFHQADYEIALAVDSCESAVRSHRRNFPQARSLVADLSELGVDGLLSAVDDVIQHGERIVVIGGPPCQGFSRANVSSTPDDPRNALPYVYMDMVEALARHYSLEFVLFENVMGIRDRKHEGVLPRVLARLRALGLAATVAEYCALDFGVPQSRRRVFVAAFRTQEELKAFSPQKAERAPRTVRDVLEGLPDPVFFRRGLLAEEIPHHPNHWTMRPLSRRFADSSTLNTSTRSFRRLAWDKPSPTVAYGHREIHVHPSGTRRLSIYEAMLLQGFPASFVLEGTLSAQVEQVSNAVPPPVAFELAKAAGEAARASQERRASAGV